MNKSYYIMVHLGGTLNLSVGHGKYVTLVFTAGLYQD